MSIDAMARVWPRQDLPSNEKYVLLAIANFCNEHCICWPAIETLTRYCSFKSDRTTQLHIGALERRGFIRIRRRQNRSSYYILNLEMLPHIDYRPKIKETGPWDDEKSTPANSDIDLFSTGANFSATGANSDTDPRKSCTQNRNRTDIRDPLESPLTPKGEVGDETEPFDEKQYDADLGSYFETQWNGLAERYDRIASMEMTKRRLPKLMARIEERLPKPDVAAAQQLIDLIIEKIGGSPFLCGEVKKWAISVDWVLGVENFQKTLERVNERDIEDKRGDGPAVAAGKRFLARARERRGSAGDGAGRAAG